MSSISSLSENRIYSNWKSALITHVPCKCIWCEWFPAAIMFHTDDLGCTQSYNDSFPSIWNRQKQQTNMKILQCEQSIKSKSPHAIQLTKQYERCGLADYPRLNQPANRCARFNEIWYKIHLIRERRLKVFEHFRLADWRSVQYSTLYAADIIITFVFTRSLCSRFTQNIGGNWLIAFGNP